MKRVALVLVIGGCSEPVADVVEEERALTDAMCACPQVEGCRDQVLEQIQRRESSRQHDKTRIFERGPSPAQQREIAVLLERRFECRHELDMFENRAFATRAATPQP
jgi:hypothetical protein